MSGETSDSTAAFEIPSGLNPIKTKRGPPSDESVPVRGAAGSGKLRVTSDGGRRHGIFVPSSRRLGKLGESRFAGGFRDDGIRDIKGQGSNELYFGGQGAKIVEQDDLPGLEQSVDTSGLKVELTSLNSTRQKLKTHGHSHPSPPGSRCPNELKDLLGSINIRLDVIKEAMNSRLATFTREVEAILAERVTVPSESKETVKELMILSEECTKLPCSEFQHKYEGIVRGLSERRLLCQANWLKQLFTRMLFILAQYSRLLQVYEEKGAINENHLSMFMKSLKNVPDVETSWTPQQSRSNIDSGGILKNMEYGSNILDTHALLPPRRLFAESLDQKGIASGGSSGSYSAAPLLQSSQSEQHSYQASIMESNACSEKLHLLCDGVDTLLFQKDGSSTKRLLNEMKWNLLHEQQNCEDVDGVICRICEKLVPSSHLETHSYICAFADKCDFKGLDVNERLLKFADILEHIIKFYASPGFPVSCGSLGVSKVQTAFSRGFEGQSPKVNGWHNKGLEGMFEDIHEMDTACIDESHVAPSNSFIGTGLKDQFSEPSSAECTTPASSTSTPRATQFDLFWLERNSSEPENVMQMGILASIAQCMASVDMQKEGAADCLVAGLHEVQEILQHNHLQALVIDTFGSRVESMLREKYLSACQLTNGKSAQDLDETACLIDNTSYNGISTPSHHAFKERTSIDDFEILKPISKGAFGKVFLSRKRTTGDLFAIKVLRKVHMIRKNNVERILAERNILITVRNPFVVRFFYSFTSTDNLYLVMEYLNGGDLFSLLKNVGCLDEDVARKYIAELVLALEYLHSMGIVHRDLKPANILVGHDGHIKLTDFGLSEFGLMKSTTGLVESKTDSSLKVDEHSLQVSHECTQHEEKRNQGLAAGTPDYLAPEILLGTEHGCTADWWSVGIILFEFITGIPPFTAQSPEIIFDNILNQKILWPTAPGEMSPEAKDLICRLLVHDQDQRLGANGASEVKAHPFFKGMNWETLALQKAAFVPHPENPDDTSYFFPHCSRESTRNAEDASASDVASTVSRSSSLDDDFEPQADECGDLAGFGHSSSHSLSFGSFSFKNLSQLASMNYDMLLQSGKDPPPVSNEVKGLEP